MYILKNLVIHETLTFGKYWFLISYWIPCCTPEEKQKHVCFSFKIFLSLSFIKSHNILVITKIAEILFNSTYIYMNPPWILTIKFLYQTVFWIRIWWEAKKSVEDVGMSGNISSFLKDRIKMTTTISRLLLMTVVCFLP